MAMPHFSLHSFRYWQRVSVWNICCQNWKRVSRNRWPNTNTYTLVHTQIQHIYTQTRTHSHSHTHTHSHTITHTHTDTQVKVCLMMRLIKNLKICGIILLDFRLNSQLTAFFTPWRFAISYPVRLRKWNMEMEELSKNMTWHTEGVTFLLMKCDGGVTGCVGAVVIYSEWCDKSMAP